MVYIEQEVTQSLCYSLKLVKVRPLTFFGFISAVNRQQRQNTKSQSKYEKCFLKFLMSQRPSKFIYQEIVLKKLRKANFMSSGTKTSIFPQRKLLIGKSLTKHPFNAQRALNLSVSTSNCNIASYQLPVS